MNFKIPIALLLISLFLIFYFNIKPYIISPQNLNITQNLGYVEIKFDNDWKIENSIPTKKIKKDGKLNVLKFQLISNGVEREIYFERNFPNGVKYKLIPDKLFLKSNEKLDVILEISADKSVKDDSIIIRFNGVDRPYKEAKIILENIIETADDFKKYNDESGIKIYYPKDFIILDKEQFSFLLQNATNTKILFVVGNKDESIKIVLTKTDVPKFLTINSILLGLKMLSEIKDSNIKILNIKEREEPIIEEEISLDNEKFLGKKKLILKDSTLYNIDVISSKEKYEENLTLIEKIIEKSGF